MSHKIESNVAQRRDDGLPIIKNEQILRAACESLGLAQPVWVENARIGIDRETGSDAMVTGYRVQFPGWTKPCIFNTETGDVYYDNWPVYDVNHPQVKSGQRRAGEGGRWGDWDQMLNFEQAYITQTIKLVPTWLAEEAASRGEEFFVSADNDNELLLEIVN